MENALNSAGNGGQLGGTQRGTVLSERHGAVGTLNNTLEPNRGPVSAVDDVVHWTRANETPSEPGIYTIREGGFARFQDGIWFRGEDTPQKALKTQMISATLKPAQRVLWDQDWRRYSGFSLDAFGEPRAIKRDRSPAKVAPRR